jgi:hypothetical protein
VEPVEGSHSWGLLVEPVGVVDEDAFEHPVGPDPQKPTSANDAFTSAIVTGSSGIRPSACKPTNTVRVVRLLLAFLVERAMFPANAEITPQC